MNQKDGSTYRAQELYGDIINLPHYEPKNHPRMTLYKRAAQFAPFSALTGYGEAVEEVARYTENPADLSEDQMEELNYRLDILQSRLDTGPDIRVTYYKPDERKAGGAYLTVTGKVMKIDKLKGYLALADGRQISLKYVVELDMDM
ncbi:MAG: YolD-like family protein [Eubacterium sp.]|nr:YolD-like family protein [Eubacterium sp.]